MRELYIIEYENAQYCGGQLHCVVWADSEDHAEMLATDFMEEAQRELFSDYYEDEYLEDYESAVTVNNVQLLEGSEFEQYYNVISQASFYPCVN